MSTIIQTNQYNMHNYK